MSRWNRWRFAQRSRVRFAVVPGRPRLVASGLVATAQIVEIWP